MENGFKGYHPVVNLIFFASVLVFGMLFRHPVTLAVCFIAAMSYYIRLCNKAAVKTVFFFIIPMLLFVIVTNGLLANYGITSLLVLPNGGKITLEAVIYGFVLGCSTVTAVMWFFSYNEVVTTDKFLCVFGRILPAGALVVSMALRFVPMYKKRLHIIAESQCGIGKDYRHGKFIDRIKNGGKIISILITWSLENAIETADSMRARGYGCKRRKTYSKYRFRKSDLISVIIIVVIDILLTVAYINQTLYCVYSPRITVNPPADSGKTYFMEKLNLTVNPISLYGIVTVTVFTLLCFLPFIIDLKEKIKWNRLKSKI